MDIRIGDTDNIICIPVSLCYHKYYYFNPQKIRNFPTVKVV